MEDSRKEQRFELKLPCLIFASDDQKGSVKCQTVTSNVSVGGTLVETDLQLPMGKNVFVEMLIQREDLFKSGANSCIRLNGHVIRTGPGGMAIVFEKEYQIIRVPKVLSVQKARLERIGRLKSPCEEMV